MTPFEVVRKAQDALEDAESKIRVAEQEREDARERLDAAFAAIGWTRVGGAFAPGVRLYSNPGFPDSTLDAPAVLAHVESMRRTLA